MRIKNNLFPYPILNAKESISSFQGSVFNFDYTEVQGDEYYYLKDVKINLNDSNLEKLINENKAGIKIVVECSNTLYRKAFDVNLRPSDIKIPIGYLRGQIEISCFVYAKQDIEDYYSKSFKSLYDGYHFSIDKYDLLAVDDGYNVKIEYDESKDNKVSSIFVVVSNSDTESEIMDIEIKNKNIKILLPPTEYGYYVNMKNDIYNQNIFFALLAIPALHYALSKVQEEEFDLARLKYNWLESVINAYKKEYNRDLKDDWGKLEYEVSQKLLNSAVTKAIDDFYMFTIESYRKRSEDDEQ